MINFCSHELQPFLDAYPQSAQAYLQLQIRISSLTTDEHESLDRAGGCGVEGRSYLEAGVQGKI